MPRICMRGALVLVLWVCVGAWGSGSVVRAGEPDPLQEIDAFIAAQEIDAEDEQWRLRLEAPPRLAFDPDRTYYWVVETDAGDMKFELFDDLAPLHASNTIYLSRLGFYDGLFFHRVIPRFMAQGGDPLGNGRGNPGYVFDGEISRRSKAKHSKAGILSAANTGPGTDGSQFFITFREVSQLDGKHTVYGRLVDGKSVLRALERVGTPKGKPEKRIGIVATRILVE